MDPQRPHNELPPLPPAVELETRDLLKACIEAHKALASLRQATGHLPNPAVLINTIPILEAQASSEIENIVTTHALDAGGFVQKQKIGRSNYYVNLALNRILLGNA